MSDKGYTYTGSGTNDQVSLGWLLLDKGPDHRCCYSRVIITALGRTAVQERLPTITLTSKHFCLSRVMHSKQFALGMGATITITPTAPPTTTVVVDIRSTRLPADK